MSRNFRIRPRPGPRAWQNSPGLAHRQGVLTVARERVSGPEMGSNFGQGLPLLPRWVGQCWDDPHPQPRSLTAKPQAEAWQWY